MGNRSRRGNRLQGLFQAGSAPPPPNQDQSHLADGEPGTRRQISMRQSRNKRSSKVSSESSGDEYARDIRRAPSMKEQFLSDPQTEDHTPTDLVAHGKNTAKHPFSHPEHGSNPVMAPGTAKLGSFPGDSRAPQQFCPLKLVTDFCNRYLDDPADRVSKKFFASGKIWNRGWDM